MDPQEARLRLECLLAARFHPADDGECPTPEAVLKTAKVFAAFVLGDDVKAPKHSTQAFDDNGTPL